MTPSRFDNIPKQCEEVQQALQANGTSYQVAVWLADLHGRVRQCEKALVDAGLATEDPLSPSSVARPITVQRGVPKEKREEFERGE